MRIRYLSSIAVVLTLGLITGWANTGAKAQSEELWDLMGIWKTPGPGPGDWVIYRVVVTPRDELKLSLSETRSREGVLTTGAQEYVLAIADRNLTGTVTWSIYYEATDSWRACRVSPTTLPVRGRISANSDSFVLTWVLPAFDIYSCSWGGGEGYEYVERFTRDD